MEAEKINFQKNFLSQSLPQAYFRVKKVNAVALENLDEVSTNRSAYDIIGRVDDIDPEGWRTINGAKVNNGQRTVYGSPRTVQIYRTDNMQINPNMDFSRILRGN